MLDGSFPGTGDASQVHICIGRFDHLQVLNGFLNQARAMRKIRRQNSMEFFFELHFHIMASAT
jgi:hypothetical protein